MTNVLTRDEVHQHLERFIQGHLSARALAAWAFGQSCDEEEAQIAYEPGHRSVIAAVLDELMWVDDAAFQIDASSARALQERLDASIPTDDDDDDRDDDDREDDS